MGGDETGHGAGGDAGEGVGEDATDGDGGVGEGGAAGEPVRRADVGADRCRGQCGSAGARQGEDQRDQPGGGDDLADEMAGGDAVLGGDLEHSPVEHDVGQDRADDAAGDLGDGVGGDVADLIPVPARRPSSQSAAETTGLKCAPETGPNNRISTARPNTVAVEFSSSCNPTSSGDSCCAAIPEPTTTVTSSAVPMNSASSRRGSGRVAHGPLVVRASTPSSTESCCSASGTTR